MSMSPSVSLGCRGLELAQGFAQSGLGVLGAGQAAALQLGDQAVADRFDVAAGQSPPPDEEAIAADLGDGELAQRLGPGGAVAAHEVLQRAAFTVGGKSLWQWLIERELLEVDLGVRRYANKCLLDESIGRAKPTVRRAGLVLGGGDGRGDDEEHLDVVGIAARRLGPGADVVAVLLHALDPGADGDDRVGRTSGELPAPRRRPGLQEGGPVLWGGHG